MLTMTTDRLSEARLVAQQRANYMQREQWVYQHLTHRDTYGIADVHPDESLREVEHRHAITPSEWGTLLTFILPTATADGEPLPLRRTGAR